MIGQTILHYKILEKLGEGGMGEVYKAQDTKLDRFVALKFLPSQMTASKEDKARFIQEAKAASAMNHPNVCTIHSIEEYNNQLFIVMEYVEGKTLKDKKDSLSEKQIIEIGIQVAEGLAAAHEKGIVHRDIKPENIMIRKDGIVQIMDFGLAKLRETSGVSRLTKAGTTMGTMGYMSPEQVQGLDVDHRTDIFSLGVVLYELLTGEPPFKGIHETAIMYEIVNVDPPPISKVKEGIETELDRIILECLEKDKDERCQSAKELAKDLRKIKKSTGNRTSRMYRTQTISPSAENKKTKSGVFDVNFKKRIIKNKVSLSIIMLMGIALLVTIYLLLSSSNNISAKPAYLSINLREGIKLGRYSSFAISPDGSKLVYNNGLVKSNLYIRNINSYGTKHIPGTEEAVCVSPCFSPDGKWLAFFSNNGIDKVQISGGPLTNVAHVGGLPYLFWGNDNNIYFSAGPTGGIYRVSSDGGKKELVAKLDTASDQVSYRWPVLLPGGNNLMFTSESNNEYEGSKILIKSLKSGTTKVLIDHAEYAQYMNNDYILFIRDNDLYASKFDLDELSLKGPLITVISNVMTFTQTGQAEFCVSNNGTLVYLSGKPITKNRNLVWVNRSGQIIKSTDLNKPIEDFDQSPDGKKVAVTVQGIIWGIWIYDIDRNTFSRYTSGSDDRDPLWTADGKSIIYNSFRNGYYGLYISPVSNSSEEKMLVKSKYFISASSVSSDGKYVVFSQADSLTSHIYVLGLQGDSKPERITNSKTFEELPVFSPNNKYVAYFSKENKGEVFVVPFKVPGSKVLISTNAYAPFWSKDGKRLYYLSIPDSTLMEVPVSFTNGFSAGTPRKLFSGKFSFNAIRFAQEIQGTKEFMMIKPDSTKNSVNSLNVILNWNVELTQKLADAK